MNKKTFHKRSLKIEKEDESLDDQESKDLLKNIYAKLDVSPALNGGFDKLLFNVDNIEKCQAQIIQKVDKIHEAIYDPDDGLFSRIALNKAANIDSVTEIEKQLIEYSTWKRLSNEAENTLEKESGLMQIKIQKLEISMSNVEKFQTVLFSGIKWVGAALGGGLIAVVLKLFFSSIKNSP